MRLDAPGGSWGRHAPLAATFKRVGNIVAKQAKDVKPGPVDAARLVDAAEKKLHAEVEKVKVQAAASVAKDDYAAALATLATLRPTVDAFFDAVMVMADDVALRTNRVRLLMEVGGLFSRLADFAQIQGEI